MLPLHPASRLSRIGLALLLVAPLALRAGEALVDDSRMRVCGIRDGQVSCLTRLKWQLGVTPRATLRAQEARVGLELWRIGRVALAAGAALWLAGLATTARSRCRARILE